MADEKFASSAKKDPRRMQICEITCGEAFRFHFQFCGRSNGKPRQIARLGEKHVPRVFFPYHAGFFRAKVFRREKPKICARDFFRDTVSHRVTKVIAAEQRIS